MSSPVAGQAAVGQGLKLFFSDANGVNVGAFIGCGEEPDEGDALPIGSFGFYLQGTQLRVWKKAENGEIESAVLHQF